MSKYPLVRFENSTIRIIDGDRGVNYPRKDEFSTNGYCVFLNTGNVSKTGFDFSEVDFISEEKDALLRKGKASRGDIILTTRGTVGNVAFFGDSVPFEKIRINSGMVIVRTNPKSIDPYYLYIFLRSDIFKKQVFANGSGSAQPQLPIGALKNIAFPLPNINIQQKIAAVLSVLDAKIDCNNRINAELEAMAKTLYDYWFVQFDFPFDFAQGKPDKNGKPYRSSGGKMVYNPTLKREIPAGWEVLALKDLVDLVKGNVSPSDVDANTPYIGLEHIGRKTIMLSDWANSDSANSDKTAFRKNDILFGKIRPYFHKVTVAPFDGITSTDTIILRPKSNHFFGLAFETIFSDVFVETATRSSTGSKMPRADWNVLQHYKVPVPDVALLESFHSIFEKSLEKIHLSTTENQHLTQLRDWLLPMLMNGQVTVQ